MAFRPAQPPRQAPAITAEGRQRPLWWRRQGALQPAVSALHRPGPRVARRQGRPLPPPARTHAWLVAPAATAAGGGIRHRALRSRPTSRCPHTRPRSGGAAPGWLPAVGQARTTGAATAPGPTCPRPMANGSRLVGADSPDARTTRGPRAGTGSRARPRHAAMGQVMRPHGRRSEASPSPRARTGTSPGALATSRGVASAPPRPYRARSLRTPVPGGERAQRGTCPFARPRWLRRVSPRRGRLPAGRCHGSGRPARRMAASRWPRKRAMPTREGSTPPWRTGPHRPVSVRPPPLTRASIGGWRRSVWGHVCTGARMPGVAPREVGAPSNSRQGSRTPAHRRWVITATGARHRSCRSLGRVDLTWSGSPAPRRACWCTSQGALGSQAPGGHLRWRPAWDQIRSLGPSGQEGICPPSRAVRQASRACTPRRTSPGSAGSGADASSPWCRSCGKVSWCDAHNKSSDRSGASHPPPMRVSPTNEANRRRADGAQRRRRGVRGKRKVRRQGRDLHGTRWPYPTPRSYSLKQPAAFRPLDSHARSPAITPSA
jgi:hypothetical protein